VGVEKADENRELDKLELSSVLASVHITPLNFLYCGLRARSRIEQPYYTQRLREINLPHQFL
jgi:hypothetical protein